MAFSVGAAGEGIATVDLTAAAALPAFDAIILRGVSAELDAARGGGAALATGTVFFCAAGITSFGAAFWTTAALAAAAREEEEEDGAEETELEDADDVSEDASEEPDSEFESAIWTVCATS